jgi:hypothetical protein
MFQAVRKGDSRSREEGEKLWREVRGEEGERKVYKGGLEIEEEEVMEAQGKRVHHFAGTILSIARDGKTFEAMTLNKNWESLKEKGKQEKHRYPPKASYVSKMIKEGVMMGSLARIPTQCHPEELAVTSLLQDAIEWVSVGYTVADYRKCVRKKGKEWMGKRNREALLSGLERLEKTSKREGAKARIERAELGACPIRKIVMAMTSVC